MTTNDPSGFKATSSTIFSTANYILIYAKDRFSKPLQKVYLEKHYDTAYSKVVLNRDEHYSKWQFESIGNVVAKKLGYADSRSANRALGNEYEDEISDFAINNASSVFQIAAIGGGAAIKRKETIEQSKKIRDKVFVHPNEDVPDFFILNGRQILFYDKRLIELDGRLVPGETITDVWTDISWNGIASEGSVEFKNGKKPEALIKRVLEMSTSPSDVVLDSFAGSGTTGAVAHKMGRRWIMIELGEHCHTHCIPRLKKVIDGEDAGGITKAVGWQGGGGFRYYKLGPTLIVEDEWGNPVINKEFDAAMLAEAMCKLEGFTFNPNSEIYWQHGQSTETDFIYVTTQFMSKEMLTKISEEVGENQSLLICCSAFRCDVSEFKNLTVKKIPKAVLKKCEWGHDDYSLEVENLPEAPPEYLAAQTQEAKATKKKPARKFGKDKNQNQASLFDMADEAQGGK